MNGNALSMDVKMEWKNNEEMKKRERSGVIYQILMSLSANVVVLGPAMGFGYSAVALGPLMSPSSDVKIDFNQANWIATASALGIPVGCVLSSILMRWGRKLTLFIVSIVSFIGWIIIYMSNSYEEIFIGRVISGIGTGLASVPTTVYSGEIANVKWRGTMVTWTGISIALALLIVYVFGCIFKDDWRMIALMCAIFPIISIALILLVLPESPIWLRERGRLDEALETLKKFRGIPKDDPVTMDILLELKPRNQQGNNNKKLLKNVFKRNALIPFIIMLMYFLFQQFSGIFVMIYYAIDIVRSAGITLDPYLGAVFIGLARLFGSILIAIFSSKHGRRIPSIISGSGMTIFMILLSIYLFVIDKGYVINDNGVIPAICIVMYIFLSTLGFLSIPFAMIGEIYPSKVKDLFSGLTTCITYIFSSITVKTYPNMLSYMGKHGVFFFYAIVSLAGTIFILLFLPETKGKSLNEIEDMFGKKKNENISKINDTIVIFSNDIENISVENDEKSKT
ncbi:facilitated trehalose transporter Tret1-2 homolog isoform X1 [Vespa velutina]|uniref:facilitated trehalose transporter Tret1-2 homolog isoform X1 n=1 Tax=Vespa velutina TaxID=202808 RepID=UPI001FB37227|nr:facilitated trehalose transporter Tret1-2 homolog isoform X1 [Vespa velutina]XP_047352575.1 facilitated trehalose transporter Tret1-2 homolog isoform X1 [Vespa velutina]XP_047352585.1 facilitated trehalose transporter Tret1-2 homolog isoform X1 [Vespa velutina]